ncbi:MAG: 50S ribosomal protein L9 [Vampirovibrionales bacterium]|nr:50S ribosomal protein L9 [Vampirovibrionales bacterium]
MQVILTKDVDSLGGSGDVVAVADGYARNYLFPKNMAVEASEGSLRDLDRRIARIRVKNEKKYQEDKAKADKILALGSLTLEANAGDTGKLYGTITTKELAEVIREKTDIPVERRNLNLSHPINKVGEYTLYIKISAKVSAELQVVVKPIKSNKEEFVLEEAFSDEETA